MSNEAELNAKRVLRHGVGPSLAALVAGALLLGVYIVLPEPQVEEPPWLTVLVIVAVTILYATAAVWAVFRIHRSAHPARTGATALAVMLIAVVIVFALTYLALSVDNPANFNVELDKISALYLTMTILTTVGFGDIHPASHAAMIAVMIQMVVSLTLLTTVARIIIEATRRATKRRFSATDS